MKIETINTMESMLKMDETINANQRNAILKLARLNGDVAAPVGNPVNLARGIYKRKEVGQLIGGRTPRYVDLLARSGQLERCITKGRKRAIGITARSLYDFFERKSNGQN
jgi:hypothetical protein